MKRKMPFVAAIAVSTLSACTINTGQPVPQETVQETASESPAAHDSSVPADTSEITKDELLAQGNGKSIYGYVTAPKNYKETQLPTIIYSHGFGGRAERGDVYARALAAQGYIVYSFDFMGGNPGSRSGGDTLQMSVFTEQEDLDVVVASLAQQPFVDADALFLMGESQGGVVSTMEASATPDTIRGMVLIYPAFVLFDDARSLFATVDDIPDVYNHRGNDVGRVYFERSLDYDIFSTMESYGKPVLIIHGTEDDIAPISYSQRATERFGSARLRSVPGAGHFFSESQVNEVMPDITGFIAATLGD